MRNFIFRCTASGIRMALGAFVVAGLAQAAPISIFNTGVDATGSVLPDGTIGDLHYTLVTAPGGTTALRVMTSASGFPIGPWVGDNTLSRWIGPNNDADANGPTGTYEYRTFFDLTGLKASTASLSGRWASDNEGVDIFLNGVSTGNPSCCLESFTPFTITSGFISGQNELTFRLNNGTGPSGLRVEISGTAAAVPEPASFVLVGFGLAAAFAARRVRRRSA